MRFRWRGEEYHLWINWRYIWNMYVRGPILRPYWKLRGWIFWHLEPDCGYGCDWVYPYGFVPEDGCPVHDRDPGEDSEWMKKIKLIAAIIYCVGLLIVVFAIRLKNPDMTETKLFLNYWVMWVAWGLYGVFLSLFIRKSHDR